jgi:UDP-N-acetylglucosamine transferase subunit ALG13
MGILTLGLELEKPMLVMPRRRRYGEVVNDHQVEIARRYAAEGHVLVAWEYVDMFSQVVRLANFLPVPREPCVEAVIGRVSRFLETLAG